MTDSVSYTRPDAIHFVHIKFTSNMDLGSELDLSFRLWILHSRITSKGTFLSIAARICLWARVFLVRGHSEVNVRLTISVSSLKRFVQYAKNKIYWQIKLSTYVLIKLKTSSNELIGVQSDFNTLITLFLAIAIYIIKKWSF